MRVFPVVAVCLVGLSSACGEGVSSPIGRAPWARGKADSLVGSLPAGTYRLELISDTLLRDAETGEEYTKTTRVLAWAKVGQGYETTLTIQPCRVVPPMLDGYQPMLPDATLALVPPASTRLAVAEEGSDRLVTDPVAFTLGLELADPLLDPMPAAEDPAFVDQDLDGKPGVTVSVSWFSIYLGVRLTLALEGRLSSAAADPSVDGGPSSPSLEGDGTVAFDQQVLGDDIPFYDVAAVVEQAQATNEVLAATHSFTLSPRPGVQTCEELVELE
jgi:hypothetical protein